MALAELAAGLAIGLAGGVTSGLFGVSPGGALVVLSVLALGAEQHVAQGISLVAQVPPTGLGGARRYWLHGERSPRKWLALLAVGYLVGGVLGAMAATRVSEGALRWAYAAYLIGLDALLIVRTGRDARSAAELAPAREPHSLSLLAVGLVAGVSSGFLGIGGGLATTVGLTAALGVPQHQAQMISLALSLIPATAPSAWIYWRRGWMASALVLIAVIVGLQVGADLGARAATRLSGRTLRKALIAIVTAMAIYMFCKALA